MLVVANQKRGALESYGITRREADRAAWTIEGDGRRLEGAAAVNRVLAELGGMWPAVAALYHAPPVRALQEALYRGFSPRRSQFRRFGVTPECDDPQAGCV